MALAAILIVPSAAGAAGALSTPTFVNSWDPASAGHQVAVDPTGDVLLLTSEATIGPTHVFRFTAGGAEVPGAEFEVEGVGSTSGLATDSAGHVLVAGSGELRMYTSSGGLLATFELAMPGQGRMASDANDHLFLTEFGQGQQPVINEYDLGSGEPVLVHTAPFPGDPGGSYVPPGFFDVAVDSTGYIFGNGVSTTNRFIARFPPGFVGPSDFIDDCSGAAFYDCFPGYGLAIAKSKFTSGDEDALYVASGRTDTSVAASGTQVHSLTRPIGGRQIFGPQPDPNGAFVQAIDVAASPCHGSVYVLNNVFGAPGGTFSGNRIEQYSTQVEPTACSTLPVAAIGGLNKSLYKLRPIKDAKGPCLQCAAILPSGEFAQRGDAPGARALGAKPRRGADLKFDASVAGDLTFTFRGPRGKRAKPRGGFVYAAHLGANSVRFSGVIAKRPLPPGVYRGTVRTIDGATADSFKIEISR